MLSRLFGFRIGRLEIPPTRPEIGLSLIERQGRLLALGHAHHRDKELKNWVVTTRALPVNTSSSKS
jgi:hypothetical protein